ncbi:MAG: flagellar biosynthetic protein FliQ, partial [Hyphomicrobium denitrificans]|nr:flagellar biosynthetic protein FliQ [Hyphomicrobium denitrificans]
MTEGDALGIVQQAIWLTIILAGPVIASAMIIGVGVAFFQALTQVQEMTLTFVPKIIAGF